MNIESLQVVGFRRRALASMIDTFLISLITMPALLWVYGRMYFADVSGESAGSFDDFMNYGFPFVATLSFWFFWAATPGKLLLDMKIVDAETGERPKFSQWVIRYVGYFVSLIPLGLGFIWVILDPKKQGWHDKMAKTIVVEVDPWEGLDQELHKNYGY
jgi:uncharacterized RDD family membrane protein YckC